MVKRICALFIVVFMVVLSSMALVPEAATVTLDTELLVNGGFESIRPNRGTPEKWDCFGTYGGGGVASIVNAEDEPENVYSGNHSAKIFLPATSTERVFVVQHFRGGEGIGEYKYTLSFVYKGETGNNGFKVEVIHYRGDEQMTSTYTGVLKSTDEWKEVRVDFYAAADVDRLSVVPQGVTTGVEVYFDEVSLMVTDGPEHRVKAETDWIFYYEDYDVAKVNVKLHDFYTNPGYTIDLSIKKGPSTKASVKGIAFTEQEMECEIDITGLNKKTAYDLYVEVKDSDGGLVEKIKKQIYRFDRPANMTKDGAYYVDGKLFEPIYAYHFDLNDSEDALKAGVNVIQWAPTEGLNEEKTIAELDLIHSKGLKAAVVCYWGMQPAGHPNNSTRIQQFVRCIKDHPAVFCYMVMDEPFGQGGAYTVEDMKGYLQTSYVNIRSIDDKHPIYLCENWAKMYETSARYVDILGTDPYPGSGSWETTVTDFILRAVEATRGEKPVYTLAQACTFQGVRPTADMLRLQMYQAMIAGANVVGYYPWLSDFPDKEPDMNEGDHWDTVVDFHENEQPHLYAYFGRGEYECYNQYRGNDVWYESWIEDNSLYFALINRTAAESTQCTVSLQGEKFNAVSGEYKVTAIGGQPLSVTKEADSFTLTIPRHHAAIYKVDGVGADAENEEETILSLLSDGKEITELSQIKKALSVRADNINTGDRLYVALYSGEEGQERLSRIKVATGTGITASALTVNDIPRNITKVKVFLWDKESKAKVIKEL